MDIFYWDTWPVGSSREPGLRSLLSWGLSRSILLFCLACNNLYRQRKAHLDLRLIQKSEHFHTTHKFCPRSRCSLVSKIHNLRFFLFNPHFYRSLSCQRSQFRFPAEPECSPWMRIGSHGHSNYGMLLRQHREARRLQGICKFTKCRWSPFGYYGFWI